PPSFPGLSPLCPRTSPGGQRDRLPGVTRATGQPSLAGTELVCPACGGSLEETADGRRCGSCGRAFEDAVAGIPDLRDGYPDPQLTREQDVEIARALAAHSAGLDLRGLLEEHWRLVGKRPELAARFTAQELRARSKTEPVLDAVERGRGAAFGPGDRVLEVGCGTA